MRLEAESVSWRVAGRAIVEDIDLVCEPGTVTGLLGPNGSGKTTLLQVMGGFRGPSSGRVLVAGDDVHGLRTKERARRLALVEQERLALVEQEASTNLDLSVRDVVELGRTPHRGRCVGAADPEGDVVDEALRLARITDLADRRWPTLSGGERQRTQLARAVAQKPQVLLLDEPTNHLDLGHQIDFLTRVRELGLTTLAALHDLELAAGFCDRLAVLRGGRLVAAGPVNEVLVPELIAAVYGVDADVEPHPVLGRPHVRWNGVTT